jgi:hypothetical protein
MYNYNKHENQRRTGTAALNNLNVLKTNLQLVDSSGWRTNASCALFRIVEQIPVCEDRLGLP